MAQAPKPRAFEVRSAVRERVNLKLGLFGASGGGKTFSALRIATGIQSVVGGEIAVVDTENRRALHYAEKFKFLHLDFRAPHGSLDYLEAIRAAAAAGAKTIIVDSMSHEHEGVGGLLEAHAAEVERRAGENATDARREAVKMLAWQAPKAARRRLLNEGIIGVDANLILCFRAKETAKPTRNAAGKMEVVQLGFMPIAGDEFVYEMDLCALLLPASGGRPTWSSESAGERLMIKVPDQFAVLKEPENPPPLDETLGVNLAKWAAAGVSRAAPKAAAEEKPAETPQGGQAADDGFPGDRTTTAGPAAADGPPAGELELTPPPPAEPPAEEAGGLAAYAIAVSNAASWPVVRDAVIALTKTPEFKEADREVQSRARSIAYMRLKELNDAAVAAGGKLEADFVDDPHAFRCYLEFETNRDAIVGNLAVFERGAACQALPGPAQAAFREAVKHRLEVLASIKGDAGEFA